MMTPDLVDEQIAAWEAMPDCLEMAVEFDDESPVRPEHRHFNEELGVA